MATVYQQKAKVKRQIAQDDLIGRLLEDCKSPAKVVLFCVPVVWLIWLIVNG